MNFEILEVKGDVYITTHENIGEGNWFIRGDEIHRCFRVHKKDIEFLTSIDSVYCGSNTFWNKEYCKKIILTTNKDLITNGVQKIDEESLEYLKLNSENVKIDLVAVNEFGSEITVNGYGFDKFIYKVIGPKISLNSDHIFEEANFTTLEYAERTARSFDNDNYKALMQLVIDGAKYVQEKENLRLKHTKALLDNCEKCLEKSIKQKQMYSEEDLKEALYYALSVNKSDGIIVTTDSQIVRDAIKFIKQEKI
jgi:hypothetical protein